MLPRSWSLILNSGRSIDLCRLDQEETYRGLLEGIPCRGLSDTTIEGALYQAKELYVGSEPVLIPPRRRNYMQTPGDGEGIQTHFRRQPEWLPGVRCIAEFESDFDSRLVIVWFQDKYAMPIDEDVFRKIKQLDWSSLSFDCCWD